MGSSLNPQYIDLSYKDVIQFGSGANVGITAALQALCDGAGTTTPLQLSTNKASIQGHVSIGVGSIPDPDHSDANFGPCFALLNLEETFTTWPTGNITDNCALVTDVKFNMPDNPVGALAMDLECIIGNAETTAGNAANLVHTGLYFMLMQTQHKGSGHLGAMYGSYTQGYNLGGGLIDFWPGIYAYQQQNSGTVTDGHGCYIPRPYNAGTWVNRAGVFIENQAGIGGTMSDNIHSEGANATHVYEGVACYGRSTPGDASAQIQGDSTTKGWLLPRMTTTQKNAISNPAEGLMVYDTSLHAPCFWNGSVWKTVQTV